MNITKLNKAKRFFSDNVRHFCKKNNIDLVEVSFDDPEIVHHTVDLSNDFDFIEEWDEESDLIVYVKIKNNLSKKILRKIELFSHYKNKKAKRYGLGYINVIVK